jgi:putative sigma-54 modulation protein
MRLDVTGRNVEITPALRLLITRKFARLDRLVGDAAVSAQVVLSRERYRHITDITLHARGDHILSGLGSGSSWADSVAQATTKVTQQAQRLKEKWTTRKRRGSGVRGPTAADRAEMSVDARAASPVAARVRYAIRRHTLAAAVGRLEKAGDTFVLFRDAETMRLTLVFRRADGTIGLIEPE